MGKNGKELEEQEFEDLNEENDVVSDEDDYAEELDFDNNFKNTLSDMDEDEE